MAHDHPPVTTSHLVKDWTSLQRALANIIQVINRMNRGAISCTGEITLTANAATTTLTDDRLSIGSVVLFDPVTANAATELYGGTMYVLEANRANGVWVITHANNAQTDRTFVYTING